MGILYFSACYPANVQWQESNRKVSSNRFAMEPDGTRTVGKSSRLSPSLSDRERISLADYTVSLKIYSSIQELLLFSLFCPRVLCPFESFLFFIRSKTNASMPCKELIKSRLGLDSLKRG